MRRVKCLAFNSDFYWVFSSIMCLFYKKKTWKRSHMLVSGQHMCREKAVWILMTIFTLRAMTLWLKAFLVCLPIFKKMRRHHLKNLKLIREEQSSFHGGGRREVWTAGARVALGPQAAPRRGRPYGQRTPWWLSILQLPFMTFEFLTANCFYI